MGRHGPHKPQDTPPETFWGEEGVVRSLLPTHRALGWPGGLMSHGVAPVQAVEEEICGSLEAP